MEIVTDDYPQETGLELKHTAIDGTVTTLKKCDPFYFWWEGEYIEKVPDAPLEGTYTLILTDTEGDGMVGGEVIVFQVDNFGNSPGKKLVVAIVDGHFESTKEASFQLIADF